MMQEKWNFKNAKADDHLKSAFVGCSARCLWQVTLMFGHTFSISAFKTRSRVRSKEISVAPAEPQEL